MRLIFSILFIAFFSVSNAQNTSPKIQFEEEIFDFGELPEGPKVETEFKFINSGNAPLIISNAKGSCGCTVPLWPKEPILPGVEGVIKVVYNTARRPGSFIKSITITSNDEVPTKVLKIKGIVNQELKEETMPIKKPLFMAPSN